CVDDPLGAELLHQPGERLERVAGLRHVLADEEHARIAAHLLRDRFLDRLAVRQLSLAHDALRGRPDGPGHPRGSPDRGVESRGPARISPWRRPTRRRRRSRRKSGSPTRWRSLVNYRRKRGWRPPTSSIAASLRWRPTI